MERTYDVIIIGAGQAGLAAAHEVQKRTGRFVVLEGSTRLGASWRDRYDSLVLFTPAEYDALPGLPLSLPRGALPTKDQIADYLEAYAAHFALPVRLGEKVTSLTRSEQGFVVQSERATYRAARVIVASGAFQLPVIPTYPGRAEATLTQLHSADYRRPEQLPAGPVLVVGAGNSAAQIAEELSHTRPVALSVRGSLRFRSTHWLGRSVFAWADQLGLLHAASGSRIARRMRRAGDPIFGGDLRTRIAIGAVQVRPEIERLARDRVRFVDGHEERFAAIVWATGFQSAYPWIEVSGAVDAAGAPIHRQGLSEVPGLSFLGLPWQRARSSALLMGAGRDAAWLVERVLGPVPRARAQSARAGVRAAELARPHL